MCIAVYIKKDSDISHAELSNMHKSNPDGCGFIWINDDTGGLSSSKGLFTVDNLIRKYNFIKGLHPNSDLIIHFRTASSSYIGLNSCHPFYVNEKLAFAHNGNFFEFSKYFGKGYKDDLSDTQRFNKDILQKLPSDFLSNPGIVNLLIQYCVENQSKIIFMDNTGKVTILNKQAGIEKNGIWYSNGGIENYTGYGFSGAYYYNSGEIRHKGGLITNQHFDIESRKTWEQCKTCFGYYKDLTDENCDGCKTYLKLKEIANESKC